MKKRLFLTGDQGCGKSTLIQTVLADRLEQAAGFLTVRTADGVEIRSPSGAFSPVLFLDFTAAEPVFWPDRLFPAMKTAFRSPGSFAVLDEIGGIELTDPVFLPLLYSFLETGIPCIGVVKNPASAEKLCRRMGLDALYLQAAADLQESLAQDPHTAVISFAEAQPFAERWVQEYLHD